MYQCDKCGREFKGKSGLTNHSKSCSAEPEEEVVIEPEKVEVVDEVVSDENELSDSIKRKLKKLQDARKSTWDAEGRYMIDIEIAALNKSK